jgi:hypothetical protein
MDEELDGSRAKASMWPCDACDLASATLVDGAQHAPVKTAPCAHGNGALPARPRVTVAAWREIIPANFRQSGVVGAVVRRQLGH